MFVYYNCIINERVKIKIKLPNCVFTLDTLWYTYNKDLFPNHNQNNVPLQELELRRTLWECLQRDHTLNNMCNQTNGWARRGDERPGSIKARALCVSDLFGVVCPLSLFTFPYMSEDKHRPERAASQAVCSSLPCFFTGGDTQFVCCQLGSKTRRVNSRGSWLLALWERLPQHMLCFRRVLLRGSLHQRSSRCQPCFRCCAHGNRRQNHTRSRTRHSAGLPPRRWTWRMLMSFRKAYCLHKHVVCTSILLIISLWAACLGSGALEKKYGADCAML